MIEYRLATADDIAELVSVRAEFLCEDKTVSDSDRAVFCEGNADYFEYGFADSSFVAWVAVLDGGIIATSGMTMYRIPPNLRYLKGKIGYISNMYTKPAYRRRGIANELFVRLMKTAEQRGCDRLMLKASDMGKPLYEKHGFEMVDGMMSFYPKG